MSIFLLVIYAVVFVIIVIATFVLLGAVRTRGSIARSIGMSLFLITLPRDPSTSSGQAPKTEKETISVMEQLYSSFVNLHATGWNKFLYGEPYIAIEMAVHHI